MITRYTGCPDVAMTTMTSVATSEPVTTRESDAFVTSVSTTTEPVTTVGSDGTCT